ncbi:sarcosine oxidase subunit gamma [Streptomyces griseochromogenes]|uniref:Sarcosine oxidase subunit gamma n=1 Tax=Streptomyces griseochromogenes TaxID=68214 RepID=A0A1B1B150_9ACTN|nr:sarcosine oxidase subunit gamma family protein [Streptomyces griseochromogenes]ANP52481.1 sarcosine oxidase subunit gamma [Streptomyces griseochromogenes]MBP2056205.1 sarcosine oxidase subunit gamma [Streptomyces griseochromogenes]
MADTAPTAQQRSPLAHAAERLAAVTRASAGAIRLAELPFLAQLNVRLDPKGATADDVGLSLGIPLPLEPDTVVRAGDLTALWLGPDEWLVVGRPGTQRDLDSRIRSVAADEPVSVTDVSAQRTTVLVTGPRARDLLSHGCSLDLHPRAFGPGRCAQTNLARTQVVLVARDEPRSGFWVLVRSSFADYLKEWLLDAAVEYV